MIECRVLSSRGLYEHLAGGSELVIGSPELELSALMWALRDAVGRGQPYDIERPASAYRRSYVVG